MKICHLTSVRASSDLYVFDRVCVSCAKAGYETYLISKGESANRNGVAIIGIGEAPNNRFRRMFSFTRKIVDEALKIDADIYHLYDPELLLFLPLLLKKHKRVVFDSRERYVDLIRKKHYLIFPKLVSAAYACFQENMLRKVDAVLIPAKLSNGNEFIPGINNVYVIANYPLVDEYKPFIKAKHADDPYMCYVGVMTEDREIENLIIASHYSGAGLILIGDIIPQSYYERLSGMLESVDTVFKGALDRSSTLELLSNMAIGLCIMPNGGQYNMTDSFNMKVFDYMGLGLPVILSDSVYAREIVKQYPFAILVDPEDIDAIVDAIHYIIDNPSEAVKMGEAGKRAVNELYNWDSQAEKLMQLYDSLMING